MLHYYSQPLNIPKTTVLVGEEIKMSIPDSVRPGSISIRSTPESTHDYIYRTRGLADNEFALTVRSLYPRDPPGVFGFCLEYFDLAGDFHQTVIVSLVVNAETVSIEVLTSQIAAAESLQQLQREAQARLDAATQAAYLAQNLTTAQRDVSLASQGRMTSTEVCAKIRAFIENIYFLAAGWTYEITPYVETEKNIESGTSTQYYGVKAIAQKTGCDPVPAGSAKVNGTSFTDPWATVLSWFAETSRPDLNNLRMRTQAEDARANPAVSVVGIQGPVVLTTADKEPLLVVTPPVPQGVDSSGQAPWDSQPDVTVPNQVPKVVGTDYGVGYTWTLSSRKADPGFLDWLNLTVPDAARVKNILAGEEGPGTAFDVWYDAYDRGIQLPPAAPFAKLPGNSLPLPPTQLYEDPNKPLYNNDDFEGAGLLPSNDTIGQGNFTQTEPVNLPETPPEIFAVDEVHLMLNRTSTDFLNMLADQYFETLITVSLIPKARADLNAILSGSGPGSAEAFLRNFNASAYAAVPVTKEPEVTGSVTKGFDSTAILIGLGLIVGAFLLTKKRA